MTVVVVHLLTDNLCLLAISQHYSLETFTEFATPTSRTKFT